MQPMVAVLPKDHGKLVPSSFFLHAGRVREMYLTHLAATPIDESERTEKIQVYEAFLWFMTDGREFMAEPATKDEIVSRFRAWCDINIQGGFCRERTIEHLESFFKWLADARVVSSMS